MIKTIIENSKTPLLIDNSEDEKVTAFLSYKVRRVYRCRRKRNDYLLFTNSAILQVVYFNLIVRMMSSLTSRNECRSELNMPNSVSPDSLTHLYILCLSYQQNLASCVLPLQW